GSAPLPARADTAQVAASDTALSFMGPSDSLANRPDSLPVALDMSRPQFVRAAVEITLLNAAAVGINNLPRAIPGTWGHNLKGGWEWDGNYISTNNIEHPYAGGVYYNIARANRLSFWAAA